MAGQVESLLIATDVQVHDHVGDRHRFHRCNECRRNPSVVSDVRDASKHPNGVAVDIVHDVWGRRIISEQLDIVPMQTRVIPRTLRLPGCESAPVTPDKPAQVIEKCMASPSALAMLLTTKYINGLALHRFETVLIATV